MNADILISVPDAAIKEWQQLLGYSKVILESGRLQALATATFPTEHRVLVELIPEREELPAVLAIAHRYAVPLYTISSGKNWGYGSAAPCHDGSAILNLKCLKTISHYQPESHVIRVEAGVTQRELAQFLIEQGDQHWMDCTGSSAECSIVGNYSERGFGHSVLGEHAKSICGMEVLLADGSIIETGLHRYPNALAAPVYQAGLGPGMTELFLQSNLGIILSMTIWLMPKPDIYLPFFINTQQEESLEVLVAVLQRLKQQGYLQSLPHIANAYRVLPGMQLFPEPSELNTETTFPLSGSLFNALRKKWRIGVWNVSGALYGTKEQIKLAKLALRKAFSAIKTAEINFISERKLRYLELFANPLAKFSGMNIPLMLRVLRSVYDMMRGRPNSYFLRSAYWRKTCYPEHDDYQLDRDNVGLIWCAFVAPAQSHYARQMMNIVEPVLAEFGFEPGVTFTLLNERCLDAVISISYDREGVHPNGNTWDLQAQSCKKVLYQRMLAAGFYPYRLDIQSMALLLQHSDDNYNQVLAKLKQTLDPMGILSPGHYLPQQVSDNFTS